jgi:hypothetical protein
MTHHNRDDEQEQRCGHNGVVAQPDTDTGALGKPVQKDPHDEKVEEIGRRLRSKVILADPVADGKDHQRGPDHPFVGGEGAVQEVKGRQIHEVEEDRGPSGETERRSESGGLGDQSAQPEKSGPVVISAQGVEVGIYGTVSKYVVDDAGVLPGP